MREKNFTPELEKESLECINLRKWHYSNLVLFELINTSSIFSLQTKGGFLKQISRQHLGTVFNFLNIFIQQVGFLSFASICSSGITPY